MYAYQEVYVKRVPTYYHSYIPLHAVLDLLETKQITNNLRKVVRVRDTVHLSTRICKNFANVQQHHTVSTLTPLEMR